MPKGQQPPSSHRSCSQRQPEDRVWPLLVPGRRTAACARRTPCRTCCTNGAHPSRSLWYWHRPIPKATRIACRTTTPSATASMPRPWVSFARSGSPDPGLRPEAWDGHAQEAHRASRRGALLLRPAESLAACLQQQHQRTGRPVVPAQGTQSVGLRPGAARSER